MLPTDQLLTDILNSFLIFWYGFMFIAGFISGIKLASLLPY